MLLGEFCEYFELRIYRRPGVKMFPWNGVHRDVDRSYFRKVNLRREWRVSDDRRVERGERLGHQQLGDADVGHRAVALD